MTPAIAPGAEVRRAAAPVLLEGRRNLDHTLAEQGRLDDHLAGELHASRPEVKSLVGVDREGADAAVEVADRRAEEPAAEEAEHWVAEILVQRRHGTGADAAAKAVAHDDLGAIAELGEETRSVREVIAVVGIGHQYVFAARGEDAGVECRAVAADRHRHKTRSVFLRDLLRTV